MVHDVTEVLFLLNTATNDVAAEINRLLETITPGVTVISQEQLTALADVAARLEAMASSPTNVVPNAKPDGGNTAA